MHHESNFGAVGAPSPVMQAEESNTQSKHIMIIHSWLGQHRGEDCCDSDPKSLCNNYTAMCKMANISPNLNLTQTYLRRKSAASHLRAIQRLRATQRYRERQNHAQRHGQTDKPTHRNIGASPCFIVCLCFLHASHHGHLTNPPRPLASGRVEHSQSCRTHIPDFRESPPLPLPVPSARAADSFSRATYLSIIREIECLYLLVLGSIDAMVISMQCDPCTLVFHQLPLASTSKTTSLPASTYPWISPSPISFHF